jgi:hypothetical protein
MSTRESADDLRGAPFLSRPPRRLPFWAPAVTSADIYGLSVVALAALGCLAVGYVVREPIGGFQGGGEATKAAAGVVAMACIVLVEALASRAASVRRMRNLIQRGWPATGSVVEVKVTLPVRSHHPAPPLEATLSVTYEYLTEDGWWRGFERIEGRKLRIVEFVPRRGDTVYLLYSPGDPATSCICAFQRERGSA